MVETRNNSTITEFILLGLTDSPELQKLFFCVFALIYSTALAANVILMFIICTFKKLHTPMYFLIFNLSLVNILSISVTTPRLLQSLLTNGKTISIHGCIVQIYFFIWTLGTELFLLSFMAFDRYAAICHPLQYTIIMRKEVCVGIATFVWITGILNTSIQAVLLLQLSFCDTNIINHFFCDIPPVLDLACSDTTIIHVSIIISDVLFGIVTCGLTLTSYFFILRTIFRIRSTEGKKKAFSTCSSHLFVISFYFSSVIYTYIRPPSSSLDKDKFIALLYTVVTPVVNPLIYSLRNKDVKDALKMISGNLKLFPGP